MRHTLVLVSLMGLVSTARADGGDEETRRTPIEWKDAVVLHRRLVAEEKLVLPSGVDLGGRLRLLLADGGIGPAAVKLTDVALFDTTVQWAIRSRVELDAVVSVLATQPSATGEQVLQGAQLGAIVELAPRTAIAASGTLRPLLALRGEAIDSRLVVEHRHRLNEFVTFALGGGASSTWLRETGGERAVIVEATGHAAVLVREPEGIWGAWLGAGYSVPVASRGDDPITGMSIDPQPRLDLKLGNAVQMSDHWDLTVEVVVVDRGDLANPTTRLPVLDGGFDQVQAVVGVSRRLAVPKQKRTWAQRVRNM